MSSFELACSETPEVLVVSITSAGKSTLINALLQKQLMPSARSACTAKIIRISGDQDAETFSADAFDKSNPPQLLEHVDDLTPDVMECLNNNEDVGEIRISGKIPFVDNADSKLVLIDTPGIDNSRDKEHRRLIEAALDASSKTLVIFVVDAGHSHSDSEDNLLRRIAESIREGSKENGKIARERFLFVINKMDSFNSTEDNVESHLATAREYLEEHGIENPRIFPVSAFAALKIRRYQQAKTDQEREDILDDVDAPLSVLARKLCKIDQLHLERYPDIPAASRAALDAELEAAGDDMCAAALVHSGMRGLEEIINLYVTKYCRLWRIGNTVRMMRGELSQMRRRIDTLIDALDNLTEI